MQTAKESSFIPSNTVNVAQLISEIRPLLPIQNPLYAYVHNNVLLEWENQYFFDALERASLLYGAFPYMDESYYNDLIVKEKIDLHALGEAERNENTRLSNSKVSPRRELAHLRNHDFWESEYSEFFEQRIQDLIIQLVSNFMDQGLSYWQNPWKDEGFWSFFKAYMIDSWFPHEWLPNVIARVKKYENETDIQKCISAELFDTGLKPDQFKTYLLEISFALKGWTGMINKLETEPELAPVVPVKCPLEEYLLVRLICENALNEYLCKIHSVDPSDILRKKATLTFDFSKNRILHEAFELSFRNQFVKNYKEFRAHVKTMPRDGIQAIFCIDDREQAFVRHLEEAHSQVRTYGVVGFFGVDMIFHPIDRNKPTRQCPPVVTPQHEVYECLAEGVAAQDITLRIRSKISFYTLRAYYHTRTTVFGIIYSVLLGALSFFPLIGRVLFPRLSKKVDIFLNEYFRSKKKTYYNLVGERGYSYAEKANIVKAMLSYAGIVNNFSPVLFIFGHGSTNKNNPFKQSYGCGACSGNSGAPNSKIFCEIANDPKVRALLKSDGLTIPDDTIFISAYHDTCSEEIFYEMPPKEKLNEQKQQLIRDFKLGIDEACKRNAQERCRFFGDGSFASDKERALQHVKTRSMDLAQPRPEYGHARVAMTIVGRRSASLGFDLGRRSFLVSYDHALDTDGSLLEQVALGAVPVCGNIGLDYYYSRIDNNGFGAGTKLPLNITSLLGVMRGAKSDLMIGLGRQMVELHEPLRHLVFMEAPQNYVDKLLERSTKLKNMIGNRWMFLGRIDPQTGQIFFYNESSEWVQL